MTSTSRLRVAFGYIGLPYTHHCAVHTRLMRNKTTCRDPGWVAESIGFMLKHVSVDWDIYVVENSDELEFSELLRLVANNTYHVLVEAVTPSKDRQELGTRFSYPVSTFKENYVAVASLAETPNLFKQSTLLANVFPPLMWLLLMYVLVAYVLFDWAFPFLLQKMGALLPARSSIAVGILILFWVEFFRHLFDSGLVAVLLKESMKPQFSNLDELNTLVMDGQVTLMFRHGYNWHNMIMENPSSQPQIDMRDAMRANTAIDMKEQQPPQKYWQDMRDGKLVFITDALTGMAQAAIIPGTKVVPLDDIGSFINSVAFSPKTPRPIVSAINQVLLTHQDTFTAILNRYVHNLQIKASRILVKLAQSRDSKVIPREMSGKVQFSLAHYLSAFLILLLGNVIGLIFLLIEKWCKYKHARTKIGSKTTNGVMKMRKRKDLGS